ncbi:hypothetical protein pclt_cds_555 [Pandoravirus celtis]|uniref:Uncharacterized protein n=1 Tax=Pandoravirus celtis TaxID=2568002 RepID=A0A4D6EI37_9VIRU|nr:hypothetical protein pclt_cds_555 [Pandoravirus celtis]
MTQKIKKHKTLKIHNSLSEAFMIFLVCFLVVSFFLLRWPCLATKARPNFGGRQRWPLFLSITRMERRRGAIAGTFQGASNGSIRTGALLAKSSGLNKKIQKKEAMAWTTYFATA